ncbi:MAG TPA: hypothetical protein VFV75_08565 [Candidatus Polarisedimenticolaceae bacterium]|nr:hypothetical protein [Candidatus Polarisedimenticolaceae bacterium]
MGRFRGPGLVGGLLLLEGEDGNADGYGDVCQCLVNPEICDDQSACTTDSCYPQSGCVHDAVNGDDDNPCTLDSCDPEVGIVHEPINGGRCDDGDPCASDLCSNGVCEGTPIGAPGEVSGLRFAFETLLHWDAAPQGGPDPVYDVARGTIGAPPSVPGETCLASGVPSLAWDDTQEPSPQSGRWYMVRARSSCGWRTFGAGTNGQPRNIQGCP